MEGGARLKLAAVGLDRVFAFGAYGSDSAVRTDLPAVALRRAHERTGVRFASRDVVIVGDTPDDIACARISGALGVAVATGRHGVEELRRAGADLVFADFRDWKGAAGALCGGDFPGHGL